GACVIALGHIYTGLVSNDDGLAEAIMAAGRKAGERFCRLPADPEYKEQYKSDVADIKNTGGRPAGAITGALIISEFIDKARWAHLDIAGTATAQKARHYLVKSATGVAVRTLAEFVCSLWPWTWSWTYSWTRSRAWSQPLAGSAHFLRTRIAARTPPAAGAKLRVCRYRQDFSFAATNY